jgi:hypothetical protein
VGDIACDITFCNASRNEHNEEIKLSDIQINGIRLWINSRWIKELLICIFITVFCRKLEEEYMNPNEYIWRKGENVIID